MSEHIGRVIDHYRLEAMLGDGGMGTVYRAYDLNLERPVALKIMHPHYARRPQFRARLRQEAKTLASLDHPSIVRVLDFGEEGELAYLAMEYISGGSLRAHLQRLQQRGQTLPLDQCLQIGLQIAEALQYAHERGLIHRDVKPSNVILKRLSRADEPGEQPFRAVLTDFGLVKLLQGDNLTESGTTLGTPAYMSPEQCEGLDLDGRSDLYSLGVVLYELLTNKLPFQFGSLAEAIATHMRGEMPSSPREVRPDLPSVVEAIVTRALAKDADDRFESAEAMATNLRSALYSLSDRPTRVLPQVDREQLAADAVDDVPQGYRLLIETPGYETTEVALNRSVLSLGRDADNDVVLPAEGVSRHHARLQATAAGWAIVDLGGVNGTQLNGERIEVNRPVRVRRDDVLQIGPYGLSLQGPEEEVEGAGTPVSERSTPPPQVTTGGDEEAAPLALFLTRDRVAVQPGQQADFNLEIVNRSQVDDRVTVVVEGLPDGWVEAPDEFISVPAGQSTPVTITIRPPRQTEIPAGRQRFRLRLRSQQHAQDEPSVTASLMLGALEAFEAGLTPQRLELPGTIQVSLRNTGNAPATFSVVGHDPEQKLRFHGEQGRVRLEPQQSAVVEMELEPRRQGWFASTDAYPFAVEVRNRAGSHQMLSGEADIGSMVPTWLSYAALMVVVFICVFSFLFLAFGDQLGRPRGAAATEAAATTTAVAAAELQTIVAATATIDAATRLAITPTSVVDADNDGLSDEQEQVLGTAADNPDTDGDGLLDGPEVLEHGCDPLRRDTDNDFLNDWDEINVYGTQCNNPDTDGDGLSDGSEVTQGTDPLVPESATATITPTPSETAPVTPSTTPTPPDTPSPSPTGSPTASPTNTGTPTVTPTSTTTGTPTPSPTATQTPTITPTPNPAMACVSVSPTVDGNLGDQAWSGDPTLTIAEPEHTILVYLARDSEALYAAFDVEDASMDDEDALRYYLDVNRNQGDPDEDDRYFEVARDGELTVYQGSGDNVDGLGWEETVGDGVVAAVSAPAEDRWLAELAISLADGLSAPLADPSGAMMEFVVETGLLFGEQSVIWPEEASPTNAGTWSVVESPACP